MSKASAGGQLEHPSEVNNSTTTGLGLAEGSTRAPAIFSVWRKTAPIATIEIASNADALNKYLIQLASYDNIRCFDHKDGL
jgi:hypothetical protein